MALDPIQEASARQFDRQSHRYGRTHILADTADVSDALGTLRPEAGAEALDVATGGGHCALHLLRAGWRVTAVDLAPSMLDRARELAAGSGFSLATRLAPAEELPFPPAAFDLVTCRIAPHHFSDPPRFVAEAARVLRPGGRLIVIDGSVPDGDEEVANWLHTLEVRRDPSHHRFWPPAAWRAWCAAAGLEVERAELKPMKQPDLEWYFETAATAAPHRAAIREQIAAAPDGVRARLGLAEEDGRIVWWWSRLTLVARRSEGAP